MKRSFNIGVIGTQQSGKKTMIRRIITGEFSPPKNENLPTVFNPIFTTSDDDVVEVIFNFNVSTLSTMRESGICRTSDAFIFLIDTTDAKQDVVAPIINHHLSSLCCKPAVICLNKVDIPRVRGVYRLTANDFNLTSSGACVIETSYRSNYNFNAPFIFLARKLLHTDDLKMTAYDSLTDYFEDQKEKPSSAFQFSLSDEDNIRKCHNMTDKEIEAYARSLRAQHPEYKYLSDIAFLGVISKEIANGQLSDLGLLWLEVQRRMK